jgi:hypothetical protein
METTPLIETYTCPAAYEDASGSNPSDKPAINVAEKREAQLAAYKEVKRLEKKAAKEKLKKKYIADCIFRDNNLATIYRLVDELLTELDKAITSGKCSIRLVVLPPVVVKKKPTEEDNRQHEAAKNFNAKVWAWVLHILKDNGYNTEAKVVYCSTITEVRYAGLNIHRGEHSFGPIFARCIQLK